MSKAPEKWRLTVYKTGSPRYADGMHLWHREYDKRSSANRATAAVHRMYPASVGELSRFVMRDMAGWWVCHGVRGVDVFELWNDSLNSTTPQ